MEAEYVVATSAEDVANPIVEAEGLLPIWFSDFLGEHNITFLEVPDKEGTYYAPILILEVAILTEMLKTESEQDIIENYEYLQIIHLRKTKAAEEEFGEGDSELNRLRLTEAIAIDFGLDHGIPIKYESLGFTLDMEKIMF